MLGCRRAAYRCVVCESISIVILAVCREFVCVLDYERNPTKSIELIDLLLVAPCGEHLRRCDIARGRCYYVPVPRPQFRGFYGISILLCLPDFCACYNCFVGASQEEARGVDRQEEGRHGGVSKQLLSRFTRRLFCPGGFSRQRCAGGR